MIEQYKDVFIEIAEDGMKYMKLHPSLNRKQYL